MGAGESAEYVNEVRVLGRVSAAARERTLPSGDTLVTVRVVVPRPAASPVHRRAAAMSRATSRVTVDTFECVAWGRRAQATLLSLRPDEHVMVQGALRRRFWRTGAGVSSMVEIDVVRVRRVPVRRGVGRQNSGRQISVAGQRSSSPSGQ